MPRACITDVFSDDVGTLGMTGFYHQGDDYRIFTVGSMEYTMSNPVGNQINKTYIAEQITIHLGLEGDPFGANDVEVLP